MRSPTDSDMVSGYRGRYLPSIPRLAGSQAVTAIRLGDYRSLFAPAAAWLAANDRQAE